MIAIQIILIIVFLLFVLRFLQDSSSHQIKAWQKIFGMLFFCLAVFAVLFPDTLTRLANVVGVGRGADLLLYILTLAFILMSFKLYIKGKQDHLRIVELARKIAIIEANQKTPLSNSKTKRITR